MTTSIAEALQSLRPRATFTVRGNTYTGIEWLDQVQTLPTANEVAAEVTRLDSLKAAEVVRGAAIRGDANRIDLLTRLQIATPAQISAWVDTNVTTIATARIVLKAIILAIALDQRT